MTQTKKPTSNDGTIHPDSYGVSPNNPRGSKLQLQSSSTDSRAGLDQKWGSSRNGGYYKQ